MIPLPVSSPGYVPVSPLNSHHRPCRDVHSNQLLVLLPLAGIAEHGEQFAALPAGRILLLCRTFNLE
jgi:hypothetical protein